MRLRGSAGLLVLACNAGSDMNATDVADETTAAPIDFPTPDFIDPPGGELHVDITRTDDVLLDVDINVGVTRLEIDEHNHGTLSTSSSVGVFEAGSLRLYTRGAMIAGFHSMLLRTPDPVATETSEVVTVFLDAVPAPTLAWEEGAVLGEGDALVVAGGEAGVPLGLVVDDVAGPTLLAWAPDGSGWAAEGSRSVPLPDHVVTSAVADVALARAVEADVERLRVAWRTGAPGTGIGLVDVEWSADDPGVPVYGFAPDPQWLGMREWVEVRRPMFVADLLLAEIVAPIDTEAPRPGDRTVATARFSATSLDVPRLLPFGSVDIVGATAALDTLPGPAAALAVRMDGVLPTVIEIDRETAAVRRRMTAIDPTESRWSETDGAMVTALGAFSSRIVAALDRDGDAVFVAWLDDSARTEPVLQRIDLPEGTTASGPLVATLVDGAVVLLVTRGAADMLAIPTVSTSPVVQTLPVSCDVVVAGRGEPADAAERVGIACLRERSLVVGALLVE